MKRERLELKHLGITTADHALALAEANKEHIKRIQKQIERIIEGLRQWSQYQERLKNDQ